jgi:hypothetical protein
MPPGSDTGILFLGMYSLACWLFTPAILIGLDFRGRPRLALFFLCAIVAVWAGRRALADIPPFDGLGLTFYATAMISWALMLAQFVLPIAAFVSLFDLEQASKPVFLGRDAGVLMMIDGAAVWGLARNGWLVPPSTEAWLEVGAVAVFAYGAWKFLTSPKRPLASG